MSMRVLVTGGSGFVGRSLVPQLVAAGHEVHTVGRSTAAGPVPVHAHAGDVLAHPGEVVELVRPEVLVHLAWYTEHGRYWSAAENLDWVAASLELLRAFSAAGGRRAVIAGTCAEYDWDSAAAPLVEAESALLPASLYGAAKDGLRRIAESWSRVAGFELAWGRIFFPYGPGEAPTRLVASVAGALLAGQQPETGSGEQTRDFLHVEDVAGAFAALVPSPVTGAVNIGSGEGVRVRDVVHEIERAAGVPGGALIGAREGRPEAPLVVADVGRLRDEVGFRPRFDLRSGIEQTVAALREDL